MFFDLMFTSASDAFIQVGVFVGVTLLFFGFIDYKTQGGVLRAFVNHKKLQVLFGTLLGLTPGCGGAIMVMPLYLKGQASFGTVVATLIATMGDAAFVLMVGDPISLFWVLLVSMITGLIVGYILDYFKIGDKVAPIYSQEYMAQKDWQFRPEKTEFEDKSIIVQQKTNNDITSEKEIILPNFSQIRYNIRHNVLQYVFWILTLLAFPLGILNLMQVDFNTAFAIKNLGVIGAVGTFFSVIYTLVNKKFLRDDTLPEVNSSALSLKETFVHNAEQTAFVIMWVFLALFAYELVLNMVGGEEILQQFINQSGYTVVLVALLLGLIPGCGPHIILSTLYVSGAIPFSALIANAICNDGDALFPILAMNGRSALWATIFGLVPAWIVGTIFYLIGM